MGQLTTPLVAENRALKTDSFFLRPFRFDANNFDVGVNVDVDDDDDDVDDVVNNNEFNRKARIVELEQQKSERNVLSRFKGPKMYWLLSNESFCCYEEHLK